MRRQIIATAILALAACKPPATDEYVEREPPPDRTVFASAPLPSPDLTDAIWAGGVENLRIIHGVPGETPVLALACELDGDTPVVRFTRFAPADMGAEALIAFVGNGHRVRFPIDAVNNGKAWLWEGVLPAEAEEWDVLSGPRQVTVTVPGAGMLTLKPSPRPAKFIESCRKSAPQPQPIASPEPE